MRIDFGNKGFGYWGELLGLCPIDGADRLKEKRLWVQLLLPFLPFFGLRSADRLKEKRLWCYTSHYLLI